MIPFLTLQGFSLVFINHLYGKELIQKIPFGRRCCPSLYTTNGRICLQSMINPFNNPRRIQIYISNNCEPVCKVLQGSCKTQTESAFILSTQYMFLKIYIYFETLIYVNNFQKHKKSYLCTMYCIQCVVAVPQRKDV